MAEKRMFTKKVTDDDNFMSLSSSAQALYLHLSMAADDDGFCNQVSLSMFKAHASMQDLEALLVKRYIYQFENGVIVIKHWRMANALRKDRYTPTNFSEEMAQLGLKDNGSYTWLPNGCQMVAVDKNSIDKNSIDKNNIYKKKNTKEKIDYELISQKFNEVCVSLPSITKLTDKRKRAIDKVFVKEKVIDMEEYDKLLAKTEASDFLTGREGSWRANFDWLMNPNNIAKVIDGNYDNKNSKPKPDNDFGFVNKPIINRDVDMEGLF